MTPELLTARASLQPFTEGDAGELLAIFQNPDVRRYLLDDAVVSAVWMDDEIRSSQKRFSTNGAGLWSVRLTDEARLAGFVGFREFFDPPQLQLLYGLLPDYWGRGLAVEVARSVCRHAFTNLNFSTVAAATDSPNTASIRVLERLGFQQVSGTENSPPETLFYALEKPELEHQLTSAPVD